MKIILGLFLAINAFAGSEGLWRVWRSSFTSDDQLRTMRNDITLLNSVRPQPPQNYFEEFNVSTNTASNGIAKGNYTTSLVIDTDTVEGLISGSPDLEKLSSVKDPLANGWIVRVATRSWNADGWIRDSQFDNFNAVISDFENRWTVKISTS